MDYFINAKCRLGACTLYAAQLKSLAESFPIEACLLSVTSGLDLFVNENIQTYIY